MDDVTQLLERLADDGTPRGASAVMHSPRQSLLVEPREVPRVKREWRARRVLLVAGVVVLVAVVVASVMVVTRDTNRPASVLPAISGAATYRDLYDTSDQPLSGPLYLLPGYVPDGFSVLRVDDPSPCCGFGGTRQWDRILGFVRLDPSGAPTVDWFRVSWGSGTVSSNQGAPVTVRGHDGISVTSPGVGTHLVTWEETPGRMVQVDSVTLDTEALTAVAEGLVAAPDGGFEVTHAPDGFVQVSSEPGLLSMGSGRDVVYSAVGQRGFGVFVEDDSERSPGANLFLSGGSLGPKQLVDVNGRHTVLGAPINSGVVLDQQTSFLENADVNVQWLAPGNTLVTVIAKGLSEDDVLAIARGLRTVDASEWMQGHVVAPAPTGPVVTSPTVPSGPEPEYSGDEAAIADVFRTFIAGPDLDTLVSLLEDGEALREFLTKEPANKNPQGGYTARVDSVTLVDDTHAQVTYSIVSNGSVVLPNQHGGAVKIDGTWKMSRAGYCALVAQGGLTCPPR